MSRLIFRINSDNTTTIVDNDFHQHFIDIKSDGDGKIVEVSVVENNSVDEEYNPGV